MALDFRVTRCSIPTMPLLLPLAKESFGDCLDLYGLDFAFYKDS